MNNYVVLMTKQAKKDRDLIKANPTLRKNVDELIKLLEKNPFETPPYFEKLCGDLQGAFSRRINKQHRLVYEVRENNTVVILRMWTHYE
ncbi:MAG: Txe/YoeB family addiction module toxin [Clostridia bacterium]